MITSSLSKKQIKKKKEKRKKKIKKYPTGYFFT
jgi:hypothetical protein